MSGGEWCATGGSRVAKLPATSSSRPAFGGEVSGPASLSVSASGHWRWVRALAERHCLDLGQSAAYSDSINDLPLLRAAARPHAVNPDRELRRLAREEGWPIHDFRSGRWLVRVAAPVAVAAAGAGVLALW